MTPVLRTEHLEFIPYRPEDEDAFVTLLRNEQVCHWMGQDLSPEPEVRKLFGLLQTEVYPKDMFDVWGLWLDGTYMGHAEVKKTGNVDGYELIAALAPSSGAGTRTQVAGGLLRQRRRPPRGHGGIRDGGRGEHREPGVVPSRGFPAPARRGRRGRLGDEAAGDPTADPA